MTAIKILPDDHAELRMIIERMEDMGQGIPAKGPPAANHGQREGVEASGAAELLYQGHDAILADDESWWLKVYMYYEGIAYPIDAEGGPAEREGDDPAGAALSAAVEALQAEIAQSLIVGSAA